MKLDIHLEKCQGYGRCARWAPDTFSLDENQKVATGDAAATPFDMLVKAAKSCPYRVITVFDDEGTQVFPAAKPSHEQERP